MTGARGGLCRAATSVATLLLIVACQAPATQTEPAAEPSGDRTYSLCPPGDGPIEASITQAAVDVLRGRLAHLGVDGAQVNAGTCIDVIVPAEEDDPAVAAALQGTGHVSLVPVPPEQAAAVLVGGPPPVDVPNLAGDGDFAGAGTEPGSSPGSTRLTMELSPDAASAFGAWTSGHVGEVVALVVDGVVVATPVINEPILDGRIQLDMPTATSTQLPIEAIEAMLANGPLPEEWAQPENPQG